MGSGFQRLKGTSDFIAEFFNKHQLSHLLAGFAEFGLIQQFRDACNGFAARRIERLLQ